MMNSKKIGLDVIALSVGVVFLLVVIAYGVWDAPRHKEQMRIKREAALLEEQKKKEQEEADHKAWMEAERENAIQREIEWKKDNPKAARIRAKHPDWSMDECEALSNNRVWIGMTLEMLKYKRGLPDAATPSNYGNGTQWQWCWWDFTPSCFYDKDGDGRIDAYN